MDWQGQKVAEQWMQILLLVSAAIAFVTGYLMGSFQLMVLIYAGGVVLTALIIVPNWPWFNRHPLNWLDPTEADKHPKPQPAVVSLNLEMALDYEFQPVRKLCEPFF
uniref:Signal peptidase complex subunit 1 n=1 Tax=Chenopodium quinoa TaxID=63459 RepID=A0A803M6Q2_CHEQI